MASQGVAANSRLAEMQMRFQKKQLQEREQKKLALSGGDGASETSVASRNAIGNGKVRQMFEQRRGVGIDRSHPLKPISTTSTTTVTTRTATQQQTPATMRRLTGGANPITTRRSVITTNQTSTSTMRNSHSNPNTFSSNGNLFGGVLDEMDNLESETFPKEFSSLSLDNTRVMGPIVNDGNNNNSRSSNGMRKDIMDTTITISKRASPPSTNGIKLNPVITKKSPSTTATRTTAQPRTPSSASRASTMSRTSTTTNGSTKSPVKRTTAVAPSTTTTTKGGIKTTSKAVNGKPATFVMAVKPPPRITTPPAGMAACHYCHRHFNEDRLEKHEEVCRKMVTTKRKIFDASKHRVKGTEAEKYVRKVKGAATAPKPSPAAAVAKSAQADPNSSTKKSNWRKKHEEFINAIREAKKVQAYLAKGGKLSDLPPPPPSENPDYIQCPHCSRRFNVSAAERHIPKCANMQHNKPKPAVQRKRY